MFGISGMPGPDEPLDPWLLSLGYRRIAGVDEVGRGALAGPVCAAAVILGEGKIEGLNDSKLVPEDVRESMYDEIFAKADSVGVALLSAEKIDKLNILRASLEAMTLAVEMLSIEPDLVLVDGNIKPPCRYPAMSAVKADRRSMPVMAASIVAKVTRDRYMRKAGKEYPGYGFEVHKGYSVQVHQEALQTLGLSPIHRRSFAPCREILESGRLDFAAGGPVEPDSGQVRGA
jgi:ribonuclease HII